jgi:hypothetical protein
MANQAKSLVEFGLFHFDGQLQRRHRFNLIDFNQNNFPLIIRSILKNIEEDKTILEIVVNMDYQFADLMQCVNPLMDDQPGWKRQS